MTDIEAAASALMADLHNSGLMRCQPNHVEQAAITIKMALEAAIAAEREACAGIADDAGDAVDSSWNQARAYIAAAIRARSTEPQT